MLFQLLEGIDPSHEEKLIVWFCFSCLSLGWTLWTTVTAISAEKQSSRKITGPKFFTILFTATIPYSRKVSHNGMAYSVFRPCQLSIFLTAIQYMYMYTVYRWEMGHGVNCQYSLPCTVYIYVLCVSVRNWPRPCFGSGEVILLMGNIKQLCLYFCPVYSSFHNSLPCSSIFIHFLLLYFIEFVSISSITVSLLLFTIEEKNYINIILSVLSLFVCDCESGVDTKGF